MIARSSLEQAILRFSGIALCLFLVGAATVGFLRAHNVGPFKDSGITACQVLRDGLERNQRRAEPAGHGITAEDYRATSRQFAGSRHQNLRDAGTKLLDLTERIERTGGDEGLEAVAVVGELMQDWRSLASACASHGVVLPPVELT